MRFFSNILQDSWGRQMTYLRIAVTDRCNLRCFYCMPEVGIKYLPKKELLTYEELLRFVNIACKLGVNKVRITGGEPFVRKDLTNFLKELKKINGLQKLHITTNGVLAAPFIPELKGVIDGVNLSLDSVDPLNFFQITRRNELEKVMSCLNTLLEHDITTKINVVVMKGKNDHEILDMVALARNKNLQVRFIEEMPFNGAANSHVVMNHTDIMAKIKNRFPSFKPLLQDSPDPASLYGIENFKGHIGIIPAYTRTFCGSCNRIRLTATGDIKNCLYDEGVLDVKALLRSNTKDDEISRALIGTIKEKEKNGHIAESNRNLSQITESMSTIGG